MKRKKQIPSVENFLKQKVLFQISLPSGTRLTKLTPPQAQCFMRACKCHEGRMQSHCEESRGHTPQPPFSACSRLTGPRSFWAVGWEGRSGCRVSGELKPGVAGRCGPGSLLETVLVQGWSRLRAVRLLPGDANILWQELVPSLRDHCHLNSSASFPPHFLVHSKRMFWLRLESLILGQEAQSRQCRESYQHCLWCGSGVTSRLVACGLPHGVTASSRGVSSASLLGCSMGFKYRYQVK